MKLKAVIFFIKQHNLKENSKFGQCCFKQVLYEFYETENKLRVLTFNTFTPTEIFFSSTIGILSDSSMFHNLTVWSWKRQIHL